MIRTKEKQQILDTKYFLSESVPSVLDVLGYSFYSFEKVKFKNRPIRKGPYCKATKWKIT